jgi:hypothetical protein
MVDPATGAEVAREVGRLETSEAKPCCGGRPGILLRGSSRAGQSWLYAVTRRIAVMSLRAGADQNWYVTLVSSSEADQSRSAARRSRAGALRARAKKPPRHRERPLFSGRELAFKVIGFSDVIISGGHPGSERQLGDCQPDPVIQADWGCCIACSVARERVETVSRIVAAHLRV